MREPFRWLLVTLRALSSSHFLINESTNISGIESLSTKGLTYTGTLSLSSKKGQSDFSGNSKYWKYIAASSQPRKELNQSTFPWIYLQY